VGYSSLWSEMSLKIAARTDVFVKGSHFIIYDRALGAKRLENNQDHSRSSPLLKVAILFFTTELLEQNG